MPYPEGNALVDEVDAAREALGRFGKAQYLAPQEWGDALERYRQAILRLLAWEMQGAANAYRPGTARNEHYGEMAQFIRDRLTPEA